MVINCHHFPVNDPVPGCNGDVCKRKRQGSFTPQTEEEKLRAELNAADRLFPVDDTAALMSGVRTGKTIRERFINFHLKNPEVFNRIVSAANELHSAGRTQVGISLIYERLRWLHLLSVYGDEPFKLSNDYRSEYARLVMVRYPRLRGFFRLRKLRRRA